MSNKTPSSALAGGEEGEHNGEVWIYSGYEDVPKNVTHVEIPSSITTIGNDAFSGCYSLQSVTIPQSVITIGTGAFERCSSLQSVTIPQSVRTIGFRAFCDCSSLLSVTIPQSVTTIGFRAFCLCSSLSIIAIPPNTTIEEYAFEDCTLLEEASKKHDMDVDAFLKKRFKDLPLHSICYDAKVSCEDIDRTIKANKGGLTKTDTMGMTALHLLAANHSITLEMAKKIYENHTDAVATNDTNGMYPLHYLSSNPHATVNLTKEIIGWYPNAPTITNNKGHLPLVLAFQSNLHQDVLYYLFTCHPIEKRGIKGEEILTSMAKTYISSVHNNPPIKKEKQHGWVRFVSTKEVVDLYAHARESIIKMISDSEIEHVKLLAYAKDISGRSAMEFALPEIKRALQERLLFLSRYELVEGPPIHISATCVVVKAKDMKMNDYYESIFCSNAPSDSKLMKKDTFHCALQALHLLSESKDEELIGKYFNQIDTDNSETISLKEFVSFCLEEFGCDVALKFMCNKVQFQREIENRKSLSNSKYIVSILRAHDSNGTIIPSNDPNTRNVTKDTGMLKPESLENHLADYLSHGKHIIQLSDTEVNKHVAKHYCHIIVMPYGDRNLDTIFRSERPDMLTVRKLMKEVGEALADLHSKNLVHGDLKMLNVVRIHGHLKLIDLDASCSIENDDCLGAKFSSGVLPPEMIYCYESYDETEQIGEYYKGENENERRKRAPKFTEWKGYIVRSFLTEETKEERKKPNGETVVSIKQVPRQGLPYDGKLVKAKTSADIWAFGVMMYTMCKGGTLFKVNRDDDIEDADSMQRLYDWNTFSDRDIHDRYAKSLLEKILSKNPTDRPEMEDILGDGFFRPEEHMDNAELGQDIISEMKKQHAEVKNKLENIEGKLDIIEGLTKEHKSELVQMQEVLLRGIFEATEVDTPTTFVILDEKLPSKEDEERLMTLELSEDGSGFKLGGKLAEDARETFDNGIKWVERLVELSANLAENVEEAFGTIKDGIDDLVTAKTLYFYLVDELTGKPVRGEGYPIEITKPSELVHKLVPYMQIGLRAMSLYNGVAGIARMFHPGIPEIPKKWREGASGCVSKLKQESSVEQFGSVHKAVEGNGEADSLRGASLTQLKEFLHEKGKEKDYAGLRRIGDKDGFACWTALEERDIKEALEERAKERKHEKKEEEKSVVKLLQENEAQLQENEAQLQQQEAQLQSFADKKCCFVS